MIREFSNYMLKFAKLFQTPSGLKILSKLRDGKKSVNEIAALTGSPPSHSFTTPSGAETKRRCFNKREGINVYYEVANPKITMACDLMREVLFRKYSGYE